MLATTRVPVRYVREKAMEEMNRIRDVRAGVDEAMIAGAKTQMRKWAKLLWLIPLAELDVTVTDEEAVAWLDREEAVAWLDRKDKLKGHHYHARNINGWRSDYMYREERVQNLKKLVRLCNAADVTNQEEIELSETGAQILTGPLTIEG